MVIADSEYNSQIQCDQVKKIIFEFFQDVLAASSNSDYTYDNFGYMSLGNHEEYYDVKLAYRDDRILKDLEKIKES